MTYLLPLFTRIDHVGIAVRNLDDAIGWDEDDNREDRLYVLLDQMQYDEASRPFMHSRSFFLEGKFNFTVIRTH